MQTVQEYINDRLTHHFEMALFMKLHELMYGIPCGPTLNMVNKPILRGINFKEQKCQTDTTPC